MGFLSNCLEVPKAQKLHIQNLVAELLICRVSTTTLVILLQQLAALFLLFSNVR